MKERLEAIVTGRVQRVMFRDFACRKARTLGLMGEVQNLSDGTVRVIAEGEKNALVAYVETLKSGSLFARVDTVLVTFAPAQGAFRSFELKYE